MMNGVRRHLSRGSKQPKRVFRRRQNGYVEGLMGLPAGMVVVGTGTPEVDVVGTVTGTVTGVATARGGGGGCTYRTHPT